MNVDRMKKLSEALRTGSTGMKFDMNYVETDCGTAGCICGHAVLMFAYRDKDTSWDVATGRIVLGLSVAQQTELFTPGIDRRGPPADYSHEFYTAVRAADAVDLMIAGDDRPWETLWKRYQQHNQAA